MSRRIVSGIILFVLLVGLSTFGYKIQLAKSDLATITFPDDYPTIRDAINNADEGDVVFVRNGTYYESIVVNKSLSLVGESRDTTIIDGNGTFVTLFSVTASHATFRGFTIQNDAAIYGFEGGGIYIINSSNININDNIIRDTQYGINLKNSGSNIITSNTRALQWLSFWWELLERLCWCGCEDGFWSK